MSEYTYCPCRDCFDLSVSNDTEAPDLCSDCLDTGCDADGGSDCVREDMYVSGDDAPGDAPTLGQAILAIVGGRNGAQVRLSLHDDDRLDEQWTATLYQWNGTGYAPQRHGSGPLLRSAIDDLAARVVAATGSPS